MSSIVPALPGVIGEALARARVARRARANLQSGGRGRPVLPVRVAVAAGRAAAALSRGTGVGHGSVIAGRVALAARPDVLPRLARGRTSIVITGTNGKTTTSHLTVAALAGRGRAAHNASGSNMTDGAVAALIEAPQARLAVLEADELHLGAVIDAVRPDVLVILNFSRDQLDRVSEVRATAGAVRDLLPRHPGTTVVANADDPLVVWSARGARSVVWVAAGTRWHRDSDACPACGDHLAHSSEPHDWHCPGCGLTRPAATWWWTTGADGATAHRRDGAQVPLALDLPGRVNLGNATVALAAVDLVGTDVRDAAPRLSGVREIAGRYAHLTHRGRRVRVLLVKNPAGWGEAVEMLVPGRPVLLAVNAREADGRDVSWLWDLQVEGLAHRPVAVTGERAADLGVRLAYGEVAHHTEADLLTALEHLPAGDVDALANYTAFLELGARLAAGHGC